MSDFAKLELLKKRVARLYEFLGFKNVSPGIVIMEVGLIESSIRALYGREKVDQMLEEQRRKSNALADGLCRLCCVNPVKLEEDTCMDCRPKEAKLMVEILGAR